MSLFNFLTAQPKISGTIDVTVDFTIGSKTCTTDFRADIPISISKLPNFFVGNEGNNILQGNDGNGSVPVLISSIETTINIPQFSPGSPGSIFPPPPRPPSLRCVSETVTLFQGTTVNLPYTPDDFLIGFGGSDFLDGKMGNDFLIGDALTPNDTGNDGNDTINGGSGLDILVGGGKDDVLNGGDGNDILLGDYFLGLINETISIDIQQDSPGGSISIPIFPLISGEVNIRNLKLEFGPVQFSIGSSNEGNDTLSGGTGADIIFGDKGNDQLNGDGN